MIVGSGIIFGVNLYFFLKKLKPNLLCLLFIQKQKKRNVFLIYGTIKPRLQIFEHEKHPRDKSDVSDNIQGSAVEEASLAWKELAFIWYISLKFICKLKWITS